MTEVNLPVYVEPDVLPAFLGYCRDHALRAFVLVVDDNTYAALGQRVENALKAAGCDVITIRLAGPDVIPNEQSIVEVLEQDDTRPRTYLAVGGGTITDIVRFASYHSHNPFLALPTAPSVDGFTSIGSALVIRNVKRTLYGQAPAAVFADLNTLCQAPRPLIAAGFGDLIGKYTSLADWQLGALLWDEPFDQTVWQQTRQALERCAAMAGEVGQASPAGIRSLFEGLIESGLGMLAVGSSRPAGGSEHQLSHFWEMKLLHEGRPGIFHGAKVGTATVLIAGYYARLRGMSRAEAAERLAATPQPRREDDVTRIFAAYGPAGEQLVSDGAPFLDLSPAGHDALKGRVLASWQHIQAILAGVPGPQEVRDLLRQAGAATDPRELGLHDDEIELALDNGHYLRNRFTVVKLCRLLGLHR